MHHILSVGTDSMLLSTRGMVLQQTGAMVTSTSPESGLLLLQSADHDLLVLCHSLTYQHVSQFFTASKICPRLVRTLLIETPGGKARARFLVERRFDLGDGPEALVKLVCDLLQNAQADDAQAESVPAATSRILPFRRATNSDPASRSGSAPIRLERTTEPHVLRAISK